MYLLVEHLESITNWQYTVKM